MSDAELNADAEREAEFWRTHPRDDARPDETDLLDPEKLELVTALAVGFALCPKCGCLMLALGRHADKHRIWHATLTSSTSSYV